MNLENLNLVELNAQEVKEVEGGWIVKALEALALLATAAVAYHESTCWKCRSGELRIGREVHGSGSWA